MRRLVIALLAAFVMAILLPLAAMASKGCPPKHERPPHGQSCGPLKKWNEYTHKCVTIPPTPPSSEHPPHGTPPPIQAAPPPPQENHEGYCVQTKQRGETFVLAGVDSFKPGGDWYDLWQSQATVSLDGHTVTLMNEDGLNGRQKGIGGGVILAANVPGIGLTCGQPYVSTDGKYLDPAYGKR